MRRNDTRLVLLALGVAVAGLVACHDRPPPEQAGGAVADPALAGRARELSILRKEAVERATDWLLRHADEMGAQWALALFGRLERITSDPQLIAECRRIVRERSRSPVTALPPVLPAAEIHEPQALLRTLAELRRRRRVGDPYERWVDQLDGLLREHGASAWPGIWITQKLVITQQLSDFGLEGPASHDEVVEELRTLWRGRQPATLMADQRVMFALTHVLLTGSGYYRYYPAPERFEPEAAALRAALRHYLTEGAPDGRMFLDLQAEVVSGLKLLREPEDEWVHGMYERLLAAQNPDGSWGEDVGNHRKHATFVVMASLVDLPAKMGAPPGRRRLEAPHAQQDGTRFEAGERVQDIAPGLGVSRDLIEYPHPLVRPMLYVTNSAQSGR